MVEYFPIFQCLQSNFQECKEYYKNITCESEVLPIEKVINSDIQIVGNCCRAVLCMEVSIGEWIGLSHSNRRKKTTVGYRGLASVAPAKRQPADFSRQTPFR